MKTKYFLLAAAAMTLAACSNDESDNQVTASEGATEAITLVANVNNVTRGGVSIQEQCFDEGELINVECTPAGGTMTSAVYQAGEASENVNALSINTNETALKWSANGSNVSIKAFYPSTVGSSNTSFSVEETQYSSTDATDQTAYKSSDLMIATAADQAKDNGTIALTFSHALSKIIVNLTAGTADADDIAACEVAINAKKTIAMENGVIGDASGEATWITLGTGANTAAIIVPQTITVAKKTDAEAAANTYQLLRVKIGTVEKFLTITNNSTDDYVTKEFKTGKKYTFSITVNRTGLELQSSSIGGWDTDTDWTDPEETLTF